VNPQIVQFDGTGFHNKDISMTVKRLEKAAAYKDLSTIVVIPALGTIPTKVAASFMNMFSPPNQKRVTLWALGQEVGEAYSNTIEQILADPQLSKFKYILTMEHDNMPPPDGHVRLLERMEAHPEYACIGGLYYTKGYGGQPQIWGNPKEPMNFKPLPPDPAGGLVECTGTGMGFNLWRLDMFKDKKLRRPWFKTQTEGGVATQDLYFWQDAFKHGYRAAIDCSVRVGHYDFEGKFGPADMVW
jgi:hypothetical protein